jgi:hypothetical protein
MLHSVYSRSGILPLLLFYCKRLARFYRQPYFPPAL